MKFLALWRDRRSCFQKFFTCPCFWLSQGMCVHTIEPHTHNNASIGPFDWMKIAKFPKVTHKSPFKVTPIQRSCLSFQAFQTFYVAAITKQPPSSTRIYHPYDGEPAAGVHDEGRELTGSPAMLWRPQLALTPPPPKHSNPPCFSRTVCAHWDSLALPALFKIWHLIFHLPRLHAAK